MAELRQDWFDELAEILRIPSISADSTRGDDVRAAGEWVCERIRAAGGEAEIVDWPAADGATRPLAVGEIRASNDAETAPTILCYGHFDVQPPEPLDLWESEPFEPTIRGEWLYARGISDDKGQLWMLLKAAQLLAEVGELPVNLRFACDGEEEIGGHSIVEFLDEDERGADAAVIFDSSMMARGVPAFNIGTRGLCYFHVEVRSGERDLHSGVFGGAAQNALEALNRTLAAVLPGEDGRLPEPLRAGLVPPTPAELEGWAALQP
nr:M20/M25/M40 family metallo-hydrolase [Actinomycetota bacterium]